MSAPRSRNRGNRRRQARIPNNVRLLLDGRSFRPPADPRGLTSVPWNPLTLSVEMKVTASAFVDITEVHKQATTQLGIPLATAMFYRFQRVSCWNLTGGPLVATFYDFFSTSEGNYLAQLEDYPGRNQWARVGYAYSAAQSSRAFYSGAAVKPNIWQVRVQSDPASQVVLIKASLLWKPYVSLPPSVTSLVYPCTSAASTSGLMSAAESFSQLTLEEQTNHPPCAEF